MRPLTEDETKLVFLKLSQYIGKHVQQLVSAPHHCFRLLKDRVYLISQDLILSTATSISRNHLLHLGTCLGKFNKSGQKFTLHITCLDLLAPYALHKVWIKSGSAEMSFLYGHHVTKSGLLRMTEHVPQYAGVVVYNANDLPLGFGVAAQSTLAAQTLDATANVVLHQADIGDYLRGLEEEIF